MSAPLAPGRTLGAPGDAVPRADDVPVPRPAVDPAAPRPASSPGRRGWPVPTRRLAIVLAVSSVAVALVAEGFGPGLAVVNAIVAVAAGADWWLAPRPGRIDIRRDVAPVTQLDAATELVWSLTSAAPRAARVSFADELAPSLGAEARRATVVLPARGSATVRTTLRPRRRGRWDIAELVVRVEGPLGLVARQATRREITTLRVLPPLRARREAELRVERARILEVGIRSARGRGGGTEFEQLRDYTTDDEFRRIDWAATARAGRPIVRQHRAERNQTVVCLLDAGRTMAGLVGDAPRFEHAMDAVLGLTVVATRLGDRCGVVAFAEEVRASVAPSHRADQTQRVSEALCDVEPTLVESDYAMALAHVLSRFRRRALFVVGTDLVPRAAGADLLGALPLLTRDHLVVVAAVRDPTIAAWARQVPETVEDAHRAAAAASALDERRRIARALGATGAIVIDAPAGRLAARLADTYLDIKASGRL